MPVNSYSSLASQLSAEKHQRRRASTLSFDEQIRMTIQQVKRYKQRLSDAIASENDMIQDQCIDQLLTLRAEQTALLLRKKEEDGEIVTPDIIAVYTKQYYEDCQAFLVSLDQDI